MYNFNKSLTHFNVASFYIFLKRNLLKLTDYELVHQINFRHTYKDSFNN